MEKEMISKHLVSLGKGLIKHGVALLKGDQALRYHKYITGKGTDLKKAVAFLNGFSFE